MVGRDVAVLVSRPVIGVPALAGIPLRVALLLGRKREPVLAKPLFVAAVVARVLLVGQHQPQQLLVLLRGARRGHKRPAASDLVGNPHTRDSTTDATARQFQVVGVNPKHNVRVHCRQQDSNQHECAKNSRKCNAPVGPPSTSLT